MMYIFQIEGASTELLNPAGYQPDGSRASSLDKFTQRFITGCAPKHRDLIDATHFSAEPTKDDLAAIENPVARTAQANLSERAKLTLRRGVYGRDLELWLVHFRTYNESTAAWDNQEVIVTKRPQPEKKRTRGSGARQWLIREGYVKSTHGLLSAAAKERAALAGVK